MKMFVRSMGRFILPTAALCVSLLVLSACQPRPDKVKKGEDKAEQTTESRGWPTPSDGLSRWTRSHPQHFWSFMKERHAKDPALAAILSYQGILAGDPHLGNFSVVPVADIHGSLQMRYLNIDFDDGGHGPFFLDLVRLFTTTRASHRHVKAGMLLESYAKGLIGKTVEPPSQILPFLKISIAEYARLSAEEVDKKSTKKGFKYKAGKIEAYDGPIGRDLVQPLLPNFVIVDIAVRPSDGGGSTEALRLWILVKDKDGEKRLFELKQWQPSSLGLYQAQPTAVDVVQELRAIFWPQLSGEAYDLVELASQGRFWLREKKLTLIDIPYTSESKESIQLVQALATYDAYLLGQAHARQKSAGEWVARMAEVSMVEALTPTLKQLAQDYLNTAFEQMNNESHD